MNGEIEDEDITQGEIENESESVMEKNEVEIQAAIESTIHKPVRRKVGLSPLGFSENMFCCQNKCTLKWKIVILHPGIANGVL